MQIIVEAARLRSPHRVRRIVSSYLRDYSLPAVWTEEIVHTVCSGVPLTANDLAVLIRRAVQAKMRRARSTSGARRASNYIESGV